MPKLSTVIAHIESHLGEMQGGVSQLSDGTEMPFQVVRFMDQPFSDAVTFTTLGLSEREMRQGEGEHIRQELVFCAYREEIGDGVPNFLFQIGEDLWTDSLALTRGQVLKRSQPLSPGSKFSAFYCSVPVCFPDSFHTCESEKPVLVLVWLIPITQEEAAYVDEFGWEAFEDLLQQEDPDLLDLKRKSISRKTF